MFRKEEKAAIYFQWAISSEQWVIKGAPASSVQPRKIIPNSSFLVPHSSFLIPLWITCWLSAGYSAAKNVEIAENPVKGRRNLVYLQGFSKLSTGFSTLSTDLSTHKQACTPPNFGVFRILRLFCSRRLRITPSLADNSVENGVWLWKTHVDNPAGRHNILGQMRKSSVGRTDYAQSVRHHILQCILELSTGE